MEKRKEITNKMVEKHFEKGTKGLRILALLTVCVGIVELILGAAKGITASSANIFCTWYVAGGGILNALVGMWGLRFSKGREVMQGPEMLIVKEGEFVLALGTVVWLVATALTLVGIQGCLDERPDRALCCINMCLFYAIAFLLFCDYQMRRIVWYKDQIVHTSFLGKEQTFHKSEIKEARMSLLGTWCVYGRDGRRLFYIEDNMVNGKKFMRKMPTIFPLLFDVGRKIR